jgi:hypothetical protein
VEPGTASRGCAANPLDRSADDVDLGSTGCEALLQDAVDAGGEDSGPFGPNLANQ